MTICLTRIYPIRSKFMVSKRSRFIATYKIGYVYRFSSSCCFFYTQNRKSVSAAQWRHWFCEIFASLTLYINMNRVCAEKSHLDSWYVSCLSPIKFVYFSYDLQRFCAKNCLCDVQDAVRRVSFVSTHAIVNRLKLCLAKNNQESML